MKIREHVKHKRTQRGDNRKDTEKNFYDCRPIHFLVIYFIKKTSANITEQKATFPTNQDAKTVAISPQTTPYTLLWLGLGLA